MTINFIRNNVLFSLIRRSSFWNFTHYSFFKPNFRLKSYYALPIKTLNLLNILVDFRSILHFYFNKSIMAFYAVARGRKVGIYNTWDECKDQVHGFASARYKKFPSREEALSFISTNSAPSNSASAPSCSQKSIGKISSSGIGRSERKFTSYDAGNKPKKSTKIDRQYSTKTTVSKDAFDFSKEDRSAFKYNTFNGQKYIMEDDRIVVYTDGACRGNGKGRAKAGIGIWFGDDHPMNISEPAIGRQTNNVAEIQAAERAISQAKDNGIEKLNIKTDSQFLINCSVNWMKKWKVNGWRLSDGKDVKNKEDLEKLDKALQGMNVKWSYVAGHSGHYGNEAADRLATNGIQNNNA